MVKGPSSQRVRDAAPRCRMAGAQARWGSPTAIIGGLTPTAPFNILLGMGRPIATTPVNIPLGMGRPIATTPVNIPRRTSKPRASRRPTARQRETYGRPRVAREPRASKSSFCAEQGADTHRVARRASGAYGPLIARAASAVVGFPERQARGTHQCSSAFSSHGATNSTSSISRYPESTMFGPRFPRVSRPSTEGLNSIRLTWVRILDQTSVTPVAQEGN